MPVRALLEALGAEVKWDGTTGTVEVVKGDTTVGLTVGSRVATVTREGVTQVHHLDVVPKITQGRTFIPARFVATALGAEVSWDPSLRVVKIILQLGPQKEELVIAVDTHYASPKFDGGVATGTNIYEPLLFLDERLELNPGLVTSWERLDPLTWRFHLRKGVKFHNGKEFNADAAVYAFTRILDQPRGWVKGRLSQVVEHNSFRILDDYDSSAKTPKKSLKNLLFQKEFFPWGRIMKIMKAIQSNDNINYPQGVTQCLKRTIHISNPNYLTLLPTCIPERRPCWKKAGLLYTTNTSFVKSTKRCLHPFIARITAVPINR